MSTMEALIRKEDDGSIGFGNYKLDEKTKVDNFEHEGDIYKVKTFKELTRLERNGALVYESVPGTLVNNFMFNDEKLSFNVSGYEDSQITLELEPNIKYKVFINEVKIGKIKTNLGGKVSINVEFYNDKGSHILVKKAKKQ